MLYPSAPTMKTSVLHFTRRNPSAGRLALNQSHVLSACGRFGPCATLYETRCPSRSFSKLTPSTDVLCKNISVPVPSSMNPNRVTEGRLFKWTDDKPGSSFSVDRRALSNFHTGRLPARWGQRNLPRGFSELVENDERAVLIMSRQRRQRRSVLKPYATADVNAKDRLPIQIELL